MKKLFAVLVALAMALSCAAIQVFADSEPCFYVKTYNANVGEEVVIPIMLSNYEGNAHILNMQLNYETDALAVTEIENGEFLTNAQSAMVIVDHSSIPGSIRIGVACAINPVPAGSDPMTIVNVHFTVLEGANNAVNALELVVAEFKSFPIGGSAEIIEHTLMNGSVIVGTTSPVTDTPAPATDTPAPVTDTPVPATDTPVPVTDTPVPATEAPTPDMEEVVLTAPKLYGRPGELISVPVTVEGSFQVHSVQIRLMYDPEFVTFMNVEVGDIFDGNTVLCENRIDEQGASVRLGAFAVTDPMTKEGTVFTATFRINESVSAGESSLLWFDRDHFEFKYIPLDGNGYAYNALFNDGEITVENEPIVTDEPITESPVTEIPSTDEPVTDVPVTNEPITEAPITSEPVTETPVTDLPNPTDEPSVTIVPTEIASAPSEAPNPPSTGAATIIGLGISAAAIGTGALLFRRKED